MEVKLKKPGLKIILGIIASSISIGLLFYIFLFLNPFRIYEANTLKWIPILITIISLYISGRINRDTPIKFFPLLFIPFIIFKLFNFIYLPFILIIFLTGALTLFVTINHIHYKFNKLGWIGITGIFLFFLFSQPLILEKVDFGYDENGELINANIVWAFGDKMTFELPNHVLFDKSNGQFDIANISGETHLITFWATWCAPCIKEKPGLEKFKREFGNNSNIKFIDVSFDSDRNKWVQFLANEEPAGIQLISENQQKTSREFNFSGIPMHLLVNADGTYKKYHSFEVVRKVIIKSQ